MKNNDQVHATRGQAQVASGASGGGVEYAVGTAKPWRRFGGMVDGYGIVDGNGIIVLPQEAFNGLNLHSDEILCAVNSHDALVEALTDLRDQVAIILQSIEPGKDDDLESAYQFADAQLVKLAES